MVAIIEGVKVRIANMGVRKRVVFKKCLTIGVALVNGMFFSPDYIMQV